MKRLILSAAFFTLLIGAANAQSFNLGVKAGVNLAKLNSQYASEENRLGYQVGAWARVGGAGFYVQPEAYLGSKGSKFISFKANDGTTINAEGEAKFTTLDIPVLLGTKFGTKNLNLRFMTGPVISFVVDKNTTFKSASDQATNFSDYKNQAIGAQFGTGVDLGNLTVDLRYEAGLSNINKSEKYKQNPNLWQLSLGFKLL